MFFPRCSLVFHDRIQTANMGPAGRPVHYGVTTGLLKMDREICPARHQKLMVLHQQGTEVGGFAQTFWTLAVGLDYNESVLKTFFYVCLDDPLPQWEMEVLRILDIWGFFSGQHQIIQNPSAGIFPPALAL